MIGRLACVVVAFGMAAVAAKGTATGDGVIVGAHPVVRMMAIAVQGRALNYLVRTVRTVRRVRRVRTVLIGVVVMVLAVPSSAQDRVIGLLTLPEVFSAECEPFVPRPGTIYDRPRGAAIGTIDALEPPSSLPSAEGGCIDVTVLQGQTRRALPTREVSYEAPAAIVLDQRDGWFRIRSSEGTPWVAPSPEHEFYDLARLFNEDESITATTAGFTGQLRREPAGPSSGELLTEYQPLVVKEIRLVGGREWLRVDVLSHSPCDANINIDPVPIANGWLPAHAANGEPAVWFYSRGC